MKNTYISMILGVFLALLLLGCVEKHKDNPIIINNISSEAIRQVSEANNEFAVKFYKTIIDSEDENVFFSPYSLSTADSMLYEGAKGITANEIKQVFGFPEDNETRRLANAWIYNSINKIGGENELKTANAFWIQKDYAFLDSYKKILQTYYGGHTQTLDFINDKSNAINTINSWVEQNTNNKIKDILHDEDVGSQTRGVMTNTIYFKGQWKTAFDKEKTHSNIDFYADDNIYKVDMMHMSHLSNKTFNYAEDDGTKILELPYKGDRLSMFIILPEKGKMHEFENLLSYEEIKQLKQKMEQTELYALAIPKFTFKSRYILNNVLEQLGMQTVFTGSADLSGMTGKRDLQVSKIIHQTFIEVDEEGTEAAATAIVIGTTAIGPHGPFFIADHPFIFFIEDKETGEILFMGRYSKP